MLQQQTPEGTHYIASTAKETERQESFLVLGWFSPLDMIPDPPNREWSHPELIWSSHISKYNQYNPWQPCPEVHLPNDSIRCHGDSTQSHSAPCFRLMSLTFLSPLGLVLLNQRCEIRLNQSAWRRSNVSCKEPATSHPELARRFFMSPGLLVFSFTTWGCVLDSCEVPSITPGSRRERRRWLHEPLCSPHDPSPSVLWDRIRHMVNEDGWGVQFSPQGNPCVITRLKSYSLGRRGRWSSRGFCHIYFR